MDTIIITAITIIAIAAITLFFSKSWKKTLTVTGSWILYKGFNFVYDFLFWPYIQIKYGWIGVVFLTLGAMVMNFSILWWYTKNGKDYLGFGYLSKVWFLKNKIVAFIILSIYEDSFVTLAFFHKGKTEKLDKKDILIFISSTILGCLSFSIFWKFIFLIFSYLKEWF